MSGWLVLQRRRDGGGGGGMPVGMTVSVIGGRRIWPDSVLRGSKADGLRRWDLALREGTTRDTAERMRRISGAPRVTGESAGEGGGVAVTQPASSSSSSSQAEGNETKGHILESRPQLGYSFRTRGLSFLLSASAPNSSLTFSMPVTIPTPSPLTTVAFSFSISRSK